MASKTEICNLALSHLGVTKTLSDVDTDRTIPGLSCRTFYEPARNELFRDFAHPFANTYEDLALVSSSPNDDWLYSYRYPSNCSIFLKILSGTRNDSRQSRISYEIASDATEKLIYTDQVNACGKYTKKITDTSIYPQDVVMALSLLIASYIAPGVTGGDPFKMGEKAYNLYIISKTKAEANALNEQQDDELVDAEYIRDRE